MSDVAQRQLAERRLRQFERTMHSAAQAMSEADPAATAASAINLASHAALAVAFDPGLLHLLRINFFFDRERLPYWVEARLLLSALCRDAEGHGLYVIDAALRDLLLTRLAVTYGPERLREIATLLWQYTERRSAWLDRSELRHAQQLTALNFLAPERAAAWLEVAEHGSGTQALPKAWFVAMRSGLPTLPALPAGGNPAAVGKALLDLDFVAQRVAHRDALDSGAGRVFILGGSPDHAPRWVLLQLLAQMQPAPVLVGLSCPPDGASSLRDLIALAAGLPSSAGWPTVHQRLTLLAGTRRVALAVSDAQRLGATQADELLRLVASDLPVMLYLLGQPVDAGLFSSLEPTFLPPLAPLGSEGLRAWIERHGAETKLDGGKPMDTDSSTLLAQQIVADTGGGAQGVLEHLCLRCGVRWPEVLDLASSPFAVAPRPTEAAIAELAHEYESRRAEMVPGTARTRVMEDIVARMRDALVQRQDWPVRQWTESARPGMRLAAAARLQLEPQASECRWLGARIPHETPFVVYHALLALMNAATRLPVEELDPVVQAVLEAANDLPAHDRQTDRAALLRRTETILSQRRAGASSSLPLLPIRGQVVLPGRKLQLRIDRPEALSTLSHPQGGVQSVFAVLDANEGSGFDPLRLRRVGTVAAVSDLKTIDGVAQVTLQGLRRTLGKPVAAPSATGPLFAELTPLPEVANPEEPTGMRAELADALRALARTGVADQLAERVQEGPVAEMCYLVADELELAATDKQSLLDADDPQAMLRQLVAAVVARIEQGLPENLGADDRGLAPLAQALERAFERGESRATLAAAARLDPAGAEAMPVLVKRAASTGRLRAVVARALASRPGDEALWKHVQAMSAQPRDEASDAGASPRDRAEALKLWPNGSTLRICFLDGDEKLRRRVMEVASAWFEHANLRYEILPRASKKQADIRIAFGPDAGSWSYLGTDALEIRKDEPTMNLGWASDETDDAEFSRVVLQQFGHALGLLHEHQNPNGGIAWNRAAVLVGMAQAPNFWTSEQIQHNILDVHSQFEPPYRSFDPDSVMLHNFPAEYVQSHQAVGGGTTLSESDKQFIAQLYPHEDDGED